MAKKLEGEMDTNNDRVDGVLEELMGEGGQDKEAGGCRNSRR